VIHNAKVIKGNQLGREIGFPTINLSLDKLNMDISYGVYAAYVFIGSKKMLAAMHYGPKKSVDNIVSLEFHILNFDDFSLSLDSLDFEVLDFIRSLLKFSSLKDLQKQIKLDLLQIRSLYE
jgi:FAD synthase